MKKLVVSLALVLPVAACGGGKPSLPTDSEAWRASYLAAAYTSPNNKVRSKDVDCGFADPAKSAATDEWMALCVLTWERRDRTTNPWIEDSIRLRMFYREFTEHSGTVFKWVADRPYGE